MNSIRQRMDNVTAWLEASRPDVVCLQEIKCASDAFPREAFEDLGFNVAVHGQKGFNGVAILSRAPLEEVTAGLSGDLEDAQARFLEAVVSTPSGAVRVASLYLPNGNPVGTDKFTYKLHWTRRLEEHARQRLSLEEPLVLAGDYNIIPKPRDVYAPESWREDALFHIESRRAFRSLVALGLTDAVRATSDDSGLYSFWDYQAGAWQKNWGLRIDHILLSPQAADRLVAASIDKAPRAWERPSDHVPVLVDVQF